MASRSHPVFARVYERLSVLMDRAGGAEHRQALVAGLSGRIIEVGAGNGRMFAHYPPQVTEVVAVEPEPRLRATAVAAAQAAPVPVTIVDGLAEALPGKDGEFDAAVSALVLCTVSDQAVALAPRPRILGSSGSWRMGRAGFGRCRSPGCYRTGKGEPVDGARRGSANRWPPVAVGDAPAIRRTYGRTCAV